MPARSTAIRRRSGPCWRSFCEGRSGDVLEIGSGTGQHAVEFCAAGARNQLVADRPRRQPPAQHRGLARVQQAAEPAGAGAPRREPSRLAIQRARPADVVHRDVLRQRHPYLAVGGGGRIVCRRQPPSARRRPAVSLRAVPPRRPHNAPSNAAFDESLRRQNPEWGVRDTADLRKLAEANGLRFADIDEMPSNNAILIFTRSGVSDASCPRLSWRPDGGAPTPA